jgi:hypothetical protein
VTVDLLGALVEGDQFVLFVLVSFALGTGVGIGEGWLHPVAGYKFIPFWQGFGQVILWSIGTALVLALLGPPATLLMIQFVAWVPALNFLVFGVAAFALARQAHMISRATTGIVVLFILTGAALVIPSVVILR